MSTDLQVVDKSLRSVFVGNIPYEATEEKLKEIFCQVGPVLSFKLVYDRETGKPKGYGFCEYRDQETALSAMRNLNGFEISGRTLRVDNACTEKSRLELQNLMAGPVTDSPYGTEVDSDKAPEAISKAVASLPPEQMFELMKQMKICIQNNPAEARTMLLQNPQLAYALLQAQVVMRIVDPQTAMNMLYQSNKPPTPLSAPDNDTFRSSIATTISSSRPDFNGITTSRANFNSGGSVVPEYPSAVPPAPVSPEFNQRPVTSTRDEPVRGARSSRDEELPLNGVPRTGLLGDRPGGPSVPPRPNVPVIPFAGVKGQDLDMRQLDPRIPGVVSGDLDLRQMPGGFPSGIGSRQIVDSFDRFPADPQPPAEGFIRDRDRERDRDLRDPRLRDSKLDGEFREREPRPPFDRSAYEQRDPRLTPGQASNSVAGRPALSSSTNLSSGSPDQEKAALIMQVLQLSDEQIALLPPDQRHSIMVLKEQIARSATNPR